MHLLRATMDPFSKLLSGRIFSQARQLALYTGNTIVHLTTASQYIPVYANTAF